MSFLGLAGQTFLVTGVANRKSVAWAVARTLEEEGAKVVYAVRSEARRESLAKLLAGRDVFVCDVEHDDQIAALAEAVGPVHGPLAGIVHSIAFANYSRGIQPFHETDRGDFLQATGISAYSAVRLAGACKPWLAKDASFVAIGISSTVAAESYGYMAPIKAALETSMKFLAKSFSADSEVRFNTVNAGPLKTSASAGIPGYLENYLYAEKLTLRRRALETQEVADAVVFLLSRRASGITGQALVVNAGMDFNYFDRAVVQAATRLPGAEPGGQP